MTFTRAQLKDAVGRRADFPIGTLHFNRDQVDYIEACSTSKPGQLLLILPSGFLELQNKTVRAIRKELFSEYWPTHVADIGDIWSPATSIKFQLMVLAKERSAQCSFATFKRVASLKVSKVHTKVLDASDVALEETFDDLLGWLNGDADEGFCIPTNLVNVERLTPRYHDPQYLALEDEVTSQPFAPLSQLCEVLVPRRTGGEGPVYRLNGANEPIPQTQILFGKTTNVGLLPGDILLSRYRNIRAVLLEQPEPGVTPLDFFLVVRCKSDLISPEYLVTYLSSEFAWSYAERNMSGSVVPKISKSDLLDLPVLLPDPEILERAPSIYHALFPKTDERDRLEQIRKAIFRPEKLAETSLQVFYLTEILGMLSETKLRHLKDIVADDIKEIDKCREAGALKSCVVLCGSVLEAVLLEWLSEIENKDHVNAEGKDRLDLKEVISRLKKHRALMRPHDGNSHRIREKRNVIHPARMLKHDPLSEEEVDGVIEMLKSLLEIRFE
ncbi:hypothetical protein [Antarcticimicrobium luteum]|uniref:Uncharacterized protein n=1 Tax=Antarcticimicrobium luteum TaxID=2547397 RepID=A0A4R5VDJ1_9RHOB|nr:hypothetical protein [Antarcticimicrobium luteum]TDK50353.1 hypothetical protein E1832_06930 [Antarcticimicrobium luteum]